MTLQDWDTYIAPALRGIEARADIIAREARNITITMQLLSHRPEWATRAGAALDQAALDLKEALVEIMSAQVAYRNKPVEVSEAAE